MSDAGMAELADARDLKSRGTKVPYRFDPGFRHQMPVIEKEFIRAMNISEKPAYTYGVNLISRGGADGSSSGS